MTGRVGALVVGFMLALGLLSAGAQLAQRPPKQDPCPQPNPTLDGSIPAEQSD